MERAQAEMMVIIGGVITLVFGLILADVLIDIAAAVLSRPDIGSFSGAAAMGGLIPFLYFTLLIFAAIALMTIGGVMFIRNSRSG